MTLVELRELQEQLNDLLNKKLYSLDCITLESFDVVCEKE